jgi:formate/nitrite transporter FocA (FNT family)
MNNFINIPINAVKSIDSLLQHFKEETVDEVENSIKSLKRNFKAGNYLALATLFIIIGVASILSQMFSGNYLLQAMTYFSMALLCLISFGLIIWRILK